MEVQTNDGYHFVATSAALVLRDLYWTTMNRQEIVKWLLEGDVAIQYQVHRDLLSTERKDLQHRIATEGWGAKFLSKRRPNGQWGKEFYYPRWTATHYTLLDLRNLCMSPDNALIKEAIDKTLKTLKTSDGGIRLLRADDSDVCVNGMVLNYASYFRADEDLLKSIIDALLKEHMPDGGFNCRFNRSGAVHSSLHSTLSVLEGLTEFEVNKYFYCNAEVKKAISSAKEFILMHRLFLSDRTGDIINRDFLKFPYPRRWRYDILSALDYFQYSGSPWDRRMQPAVDYLLKKRNKEGSWNVNAKYPGQTHFDMEKAGKPSRWNTLRALRVLKHFSVKDRSTLIFVFGLPGSGKSYFAEKLAKRLNADYVNSDRLRKKLFPTRTYSPLEKNKVYEEMMERMNLAISQKKQLVLDATFHKRETRNKFMEKAQGAELFFIEVQADAHVAKERLKKKRPYSEADFEVYQLIRKQWEPLTTPHLILQSTNENIEEMLQKAISYLEKTNDGKADT